MKSKLILAFLIAASIAGCKSPSAPSSQLAVSGANDVLITGNKAVVLASGSGDLYVLDLSGISPSDRALLVVNEGNFGKANSSADLVLFHKNGMATDTIIQRNFLPDSSSRLLATISMGINSPNKMALISPTRLLVTERYATSAEIVDLTTNTVVDSIRLGEPSYAVAVLNNTAFITSGAQSYAGPFHVNVVDLSSFTITAKYTINGSGEQVVADSADNKIIIAAPGDYASYKAMYYFIDANTKTIRDSVVMGDSTDAPDLTDGLKKYTINNSNVYAPFVPPQTLGTPVVRPADYIYKGIYDAQHNELYLGVYDFTSGAGKVDVYNAGTGAFEWSFTTGIAPGHFAFYH